MISRYCLWEFSKNIALDWRANLQIRWCCRMLSLARVNDEASYVKDGFQCARNFVDTEDMSRTLDFIATRIRSGKPSDADESARGGVYRINSLHGAPRLVEDLTAKAAKLIGAPLVHTLSYVQIYKKGGVLPLHVDEPDCGVTVTVTLDYQSETLWPLFLVTDGTIISAALNKGDALLFVACRFPHCRKPLEGESWTQMTLHFISESVKRK